MAAKVYVFSWENIFVQWKCWNWQEPWVMCTQMSNSLATPHFEPVTNCYFLTFSPFLLTSLFSKFRCWRHPIWWCLYFSVAISMWISQLAWQLIARYPAFLHVLNISSEYEIVITISSRPHVSFPISAMQPSFLFLCTFQTTFVFNSLRKRLL